MKPWSFGAAMFIAALFLSPSGPAAAQDVTLSSADGTMVISGDLIAYDGEYLRLETEFGPLTLDARGLDCEGPGCPLLTGAIVESVIEGTPVIIEQLLPSILGAFARAQGLTLTQTNNDDELLFDLGDPTRAAPVMRMRLRPTSGDDGLMALVSGEADLALTLTPLGGPDFRLHVVALDAFVPTTALDAVAGAIDMQALLDVLRGTTRNWMALGGPDVPIELHLRNREAGEQHALGARLLELGVEAMSDSAQRHGASAALAEAVARDPLALGMMLRSAATGLRVLPLIGECGIALDADPFALKSGTYPLVQPVFAVQRRQRLPLRLRQLLDFFGEPEATAAIRRAGFVEPRPTPLPPEAQGPRLVDTLLAEDLADDLALLDELRRVAALIRSARQLSVAFRFEPGTSVIDAASQARIRTLARAIEAGAHDDHEVILVGFTDSQGEPDRNRRLALSRAEAVRRELLEAAPLRDAERVPLSAQGFGPILPVACNDAPWGRSLNRRVEVWLRPLGADQTPAAPG